jgi:SAM-dependent methyltransferase
VPWYEPWHDLKSQRFDFPRRLPSSDIPFQLDEFQAGIAGAEGNGRWILEIGCASRHAEPYFTARGFKYVGSDYNKRGSGPHLMADAHNLPFADQSFDLVYSMAVLEHLICPLTAAIEAARVLRPGGAFFGSAAFIYGFHDVASFHHMSNTIRRMIRKKPINLQERRSQIAGGLNFSARKAV